MDNATLSQEIKLVHHECGTCGVPFAMPQKLYDSCYIRGVEQIDGVSISQQAARFFVSALRVGLRGEQALGPVQRPPIGLGHISWIQLVNALNCLSVDSAMAMPDHELANRLFWAAAQEAGK